MKKLTGDLIALLCILVLAYSITYAVVEAAQSAHAEKVLEVKTCKTIGRRDVAC